MKIYAVTNSVISSRDRGKLLDACRNLVFGMFMVGCISGCASIPQGRYQDFSEASNTVKSKLADTYVRIEKEERDFNVITAPDKQLSVDSFDPKINGKNYGIDEQLNKREALLNVLVNYAQSLESLAGRDYAAGVDKSAQSLAASIRGISGTDPALANVFGTVVDGLGKVATSSMREDALKKVMDRGQAGVEAICNQMQVDNGKIIKYVNLMRDRYIAHAQEARPKYGTWDRYKFDLEAAAKLDEFRQIDDALISSSSALKKLPDAHRQIMQSLDNNSVSLDALHDFISEAHDLSNFYRNLPTK